METVELEVVRKQLFDKYGVQFTEQTARRWLSDQMKAEAKLQKKREEQRTPETLPESPRDEQIPGPSDGITSTENVSPEEVKTVESPPEERFRYVRLEDAEERVSDSEDSFHTVVFVDEEVFHDAEETHSHQKSPEEIQEESGSKEVIEEDPEDEEMPECHALLLRNRGTDCFVNSAVNMLSAIDDIREWAESIWEWNNNNEEAQDTIFRRELSRVLAGRIPTVARIRKEFENEDLQFGQNDANEALQELMKNVPAEAKQSIVIERIAKWNCESCGDSETVTEKLEDIYRAVYQVSGFFQILPEEQQERTCLRCDKQREREILRYEVPNSTSHIIVRLSKGEAGNFVTDIPERFTLFGAQWKMLCASHYLPNRFQPYGRGGHYVTWWKYGDEWKCISDDEVLTFEDVSFDELDIGIMVYKRI